MKSVFIDYKNMFYPPGGIFKWPIIFLELVAIGIALVAMAYYGQQEPEVIPQAYNSIPPLVG